MTPALELLRLATAAAEPDVSVKFDTLYKGLEQFNNHTIQLQHPVNGALTGTVVITKIHGTGQSSLVALHPTKRNARWFEVQFKYEAATTHMSTHVYTVYDNPHRGGVSVVRETFVDGVNVPELATAQTALVFFQNLHNYEMKRMLELRARKRVTAADTVQRVPGVWCGYQIRFQDGTVVPTDSGCKGKCMMQYDPVTGRIYQHGPDGFQWHGRVMPGREEAVAATEPAGVSDWENLPDRVQNACKRFEHEDSLGVDYDELEFEPDHVVVDISTAYDTNDGEGGVIHAQFSYAKGVLSCYIGNEKIVIRKMPNLTPAQWVAAVVNVLTYLDNIVVRTRNRINTEIKAADAEFTASLSKMFRVQVKPNMLNLHVTWSV